MRTPEGCANAVRYLLENVGPVIPYRLRREILQELSDVEVERELEDL